MFPPLTLKIVGICGTSGVQSHIRGVSRSPPHHIWTHPSLHSLSLHSAENRKKQMTRVWLKQVFAAFLFSLSSLVLSEALKGSNCHSFFLWVLFRVQRSVLRETVDVSNASLKSRIKGIWNLLPDLMWQCDCRIMQPWKHSPLTPWWRTDLNSTLIYARV